MMTPVQKLGGIEARSVCLVTRARQLGGSANLTIPIINP